jgi:hypothetical protein
VDYCAAFGPSTELVEDLLIWRSCLSRCLSYAEYASSSASCTGACWLLSAMMRCAGA